MMISMALFAQLAASCAPAVHVQTLAAIAKTESGLHAGAIHDNSTGLQYRPRTREEAIALATELVNVKGHSVDLGLMQINSKNLAGLNLALADAFDPCNSIAAGARVLAASYRPSPSAPNTQRSLLETISRYNTGDPERGFGNGYVAKVVASAEQLVPAIRSDEITPSDLVRKEPPRSGTSTGSGLSLMPAAPPEAWDVFGRARFKREQSQRTPLLPQPRHPGQQVRPEAEQANAQ